MIAGFIRRLVRLTLLLVVPLLVAAAGVFAYAMGGRIVSTENAYVRTDVVAISAEVDGRVLRVYVDDNQFVREGGPLFEVDPEPFVIELEAIEAEMAMVRQDVASTRAQYWEIEADIEITLERIRYLTGEFERHQKLAKSGHGSQSGLDSAEHDLETARRRTDALKQRKLKVIAELGGALDKPVEQHPRYLRAIAAQDRAALNLAYSKVYAPVTGYVGNITLEPGERVESGDVVFPLVSSRERWVEANLKEVHLTHVVVGQPAQVRFDSYPDQVYEATVASISPATGAEFSLLPAQNATGNWVKVVQWVPVKLKLHASPDMPMLQAGLTATVEIDTGHERQLGLFIKEELDRNGVDYSWWSGD
jgi:membrane fusion protein (multidrug efflux system)